MNLLALIGLLLVFGPGMIFIIERGGAGDPQSWHGDFIHWLMSKTPEQMFLMHGSWLAGVALVTASLAQRAWQYQ